MTPRRHGLSLNRYKNTTHEEATYRPPGEIFKSLVALEKEINTGMKELKDMLKRINPLTNALVSGPKGRHPSALPNGLVMRHTN